MANALIEFASWSMVSCAETERIVRFDSRDFEIKAIFGCQGVPWLRCKNGSCVCSEAIRRANVNCGQHRVTAVYMSSTDWSGSKTALEKPVKRFAT